MIPIKRAIELVMSRCFLTVFSSADESSRIGRPTNDLTKILDQFGKQNSSKL
jgi:hypothetical protein